MDLDTSNNNILMWTCHGGSNQKWVYDSATKELKSETDLTKCVDYDVAGSNLILYDCHGASNQKFNFPKDFFA